MIREPAVAGRFYPNEPEELSRQVESFCAIPQGVTRRRVVACMVPHAGYRYSGHVAGAVYAQLELPRRLVLIGPRHFPRGAAQAILSEGGWRTPLGLAKINAPLAAEIKGACPALVEDAVAHATEHALEVQLPFLQQLLGEFSFVPVALGTVHYPALESLGEALAEVIAREKEPVLLVASSDMNHYESDDITRRKDKIAIERILTLDAPGLYDAVRRESISMCGYGAAVSALIAASKLGAQRAELVRYATSADISGDSDQAVGYAGVIIE